MIFMSTFGTARGMRDLLPEEVEKMRYVEGVTRRLARLYGYEEVITPVVEPYELLAAKSGEEIRERMYAFQDLGGRRVALRPEFTASTARLLTTKMANRPKPIRLFCTGSLYRYDEPQYGRYREFWQSNYELIGSDQPEADAEILMLTYDLMERLGLHKYHFRIGHMGVLRGILNQEGVREEQQNRIMQLIDKGLWDEALKVIRGLGVSRETLSVLKRVFETKGKNPSQVLERTRRVVRGFESAASSAENLQNILELTREEGIEFEVLVEAGFARGLEYYTGMIFEVYAPGIDVALGGGGRYDRLIELFGGEPTPAVGVAHGIDRLVLAMEKQDAFPRVQEGKRVAVIPVGTELAAKAMGISLELRRAGIPTEMEVMGRTVSRALSDADRRGCAYAVIVGPEEVKEGKVILRDMKKREQKPVETEAITKEILEGQE